MNQTLSFVINNLFTNIERTEILAERYENEMSRLSDPPRAFVPHQTRRSVTIATLAQIANVSRALHPPASCHWGRVNHKSTPNRVTLIRN